MGVLASHLCSLDKITRPTIHMSTNLFAHVSATPPLSTTPKPMKIGSQHPEGYIKLTPAYIMVDCLFLFVTDGSAHIHSDQKKTNY